MFQKISLIFIALLLTACTTNTEVVPNPSLPQSTTAPAPTLTLAPTSTQTATPQPLALRVDGNSITLAEYKNELLRLQDALKITGETLEPAGQQKRILDEFTNQLILANAANKDGFTLSDEAFQKRLQDAIQQSGGDAAYQAWLQKNHYSSAEFQVALRRSIAATWQRDKIAAAAPTAAEQVHARQILLLEEATADRFLNLLKAGADFATLAYQADPDLGGDLGWFPKGYLLLPEIEKIAFELEPGKISPVIKTIYGFHIVQVIERKPAQPLSTEARRQIQHNLLSKWMNEQLAKARIEILVPKP